MVAVRKITTKLPNAPDINQYKKNTVAFNRESIGRSFGICPNYKPTTNQMQIFAKPPSGY